MEENCNLSWKCVYLAWAKIWNIELKLGILVYYFFSICFYWIYEFEYDG